MKKILSYIGYGALALFVIAAFIWDYTKPPYKLAYPVVYVEAGNQEVEMLPASLQWINESGESNVGVVDIWLYAKNGENIPVLEASPGEELALSFAYRDEEQGTYKSVEFEADVHTDAFLFAETDLVEWEFYEFPIDEEDKFGFFAPNETGVYALEVEFKADEEQYAQYAVKLVVE